MTEHDCRLISPQINGHSRLQLDLKPNCCSFAVASKTSTYILNFTLLQKLFHWILNLIHTFLSSVAKLFHSFASDFVNS